MLVSSQHFKTFRNKNIIEHGAFATWTAAAKVHTAVFGLQASAYRRKLASLPGATPLSIAAVMGDKACGRSLGCQLSTATVCESGCLLPVRSCWPYSCFLNLSMWAVQQVWELPCHMPQALVQLLLENDAQVDIQTLVRICQTLPGLSLTDIL